MNSKKYVIWDKDPMVEKESALYVATTRPLENLYLLYTDNLASKLPTPDSHIYARNEAGANGPF